jgi:hypothetical protein
MHPAQQGYRTPDSHARAGSLRKTFASDVDKSTNVIKRSAHLVFSVALIAVVTASICEAATGSVSGVVRDSSGVAQIGAEVELLRPDLSVVAVVYTNVNGRFAISSIAPGHYSVKALGQSFLPSLREDVRVRTGTVVNLTLNTLYEVMQWLPSQPRTAAMEQDDWKWTLRSAANRPLLRWLEDGPLVVVSDGSGTAPKLKARLVAVGQEGTFGESGERLAASVEQTPSDSRELLAQVDFAPGTDAGMESMLGFRQDLGFAGSVQSVAAVSIHPEISTPGSEGLDEAGFRSSETLNFGDSLRVQAGSTQVFARFANNSPNTIFAAMPFAAVAFRTGDNSNVEYRMATSMPAVADAGASQTEAWLPAASMRDGKLALAHGLHQEVGWERQTDRSGMSVRVYADRMENPVLEAADRNPSGSLPASMLSDSVSGLIRTAGPGYSSYGMVATAEHRIAGKSQVRLTYANGNALVLNASTDTPGQQNQLLPSAHARHAQAYSISLSGTLEGSGTRWRATYRWQPESSLTAIASYAENVPPPYLNFQFRQPIHLRREGTGGFEALLNLRNLLAQGYQPYLLNDGSLLVFAQTQRAVSGGFAFNF